MSKRKKTFLLLCALTAPWLICTEQSAAETLRPVRIALIKLADGANIWAAKKTGIFERNGLNAELVEFTSGTKSIMAQQSGSVDILLTVPGSAFSAHERGFDIVALVSQELAHRKPPDSGTIQVLKDGPIRSVSDLVGKKLGTSARHSQSFVTLQTVLRKHGVDPKDVQFLEMPVATQVASLLAGRLDAANVADPFTTQLLQTGKTRVLSWSNIETVPGQPIGVWFAKRSYVEENPDIVEAFIRSVEESIDYINADVDRARALTAEFTGLDPEIVAAMTPLVFSTEVDLSTWQETIDMMHENGELQERHKPHEYFSKYIERFIVD